MIALDMLSDVYRLAATVLAAGADEPPEARLALAWVARNRGEAALCSGQFGFAAAGSSAGGDVVMEEGEGPEAGQIDGAGDQFRALAIACQVLAGDLADPTGGAVLFHRHDEQPGWASGLCPSALLGSHFFYRLD